MNRYSTLLVGLVIFVACTAIGTATWPTFLLKNKIQALFSYWLLFFSIIFEIALLRLLIKSESLLKISITVIFMNQASAMVSMGLLLGIDALLAFFQHQFIALFVGKNHLTKIEEVLLNTLYVTVVYVSSVMINAAVEWAIAVMYFKDVGRKRLFWYLVLINALSIGIGIFGLLGYEYFFEPVRATRPIVLSRV